MSVIFAILLIVGLSIFLGMVRPPRIWIVGWWFVAAITILLAIWVIFTLVDVNGGPQLRTPHSLTNG